MFKLKSILKHNNPVLPQLFFTSLVVAAHLFLGL